MPQLRVSCPCGHSFVATEGAVARGMVACPACKARIALSEPSDPAKVKIAIALGAVALLIVGVILILFLRGGSPTPAETAAPKAPKVKPVVAAPVHADPAKPVAPAPLVGSSVSRPAVQEAPKPVTPPTPKEVLFPQDLLQKLRLEVVALHKFYLAACLPSEDIAKLQKLVNAGRGNEEDLEFLKNSLEEPGIARAAAEIAQIGEEFVRLNADAMGGLPLDKLELTDGRVLEVRIVETKEDSIRFERKVGIVVGIMAMKRDQIKEVHKGKGSGSEFKVKWDALQKSPKADAGLVLMGWCKERAFAAQTKLAALLILKLDPGIASARVEAGLPAQFGEAPVAAERPRTQDAPANPGATADPGGPEGPAITYQGKTWTAKQLKEKLFRDNYVIFDGEWYAPKEKLLSIPGLYRYDRDDKKTIMISGATAPVNHDLETTWKTILSPGSGMTNEQKETRQLRRFYAPTLTVETLESPNRISYDGNRKILRTLVDKPSPKEGTTLTGEMTVTVPVGARIIEAFVKTVVEVKAGGQVVVFLMKGGERVKLYQAAAKEDDSRKIPVDLVRGVTDLEFVIAVSMQANYLSKTERRKPQGLKLGSNGQVLQKEIEIIHERLIPDYAAVIFPSNSNTIEVFRVRAIVAEKAEGLVKLFTDAGAAEFMK